MVFIRNSLILLGLILYISKGCNGIQCYQCATQKGEKEDSCGAYNKFNKDKYSLTDCNSEESNMPGTFCVKETRQGPKGFIWDGRWRQVIRRCASVSSTGVTGVCNWGIHENGVYWEECYCAEDGCNGSTTLSVSMIMIILPISLVILSINLFL